MHSNLSSRLCGIYFNIVNRRHHCRNCGKLLCDDCSKYKRQLPHTSKPVRVCKICNEYLQLANEPLHRDSRIILGPVPIVRDFREPLPLEISSLLKISKGYCFESFSKQEPSTSPKLLETDSNSPYYQHYFYGRDHRNYLGGHPDVGPVIVSVTAPEELEGLGRRTIEDFNPKLRALIRTKQADIWVFIPYQSKRVKKALKEAIESSDSLDAIKLSSVKLKRVVSSELPKELLSLEQKLVPSSYKFGVLYCAGRQQTENEMFSNTQGSNEFNEFLELLGEKIRLKGWDGYRGGLDVKSDTTGTHSIFTTYHGLSVMFHVSTLLPYTRNDQQQIERKRHLGNDVILIVFKDSDYEPFDPSCIKSEFNHIFVVVTVDRSQRGPKKFYKIAFASKDGGKIVEPALPSPPIFQSGPQFHHWLITKLINCERATLQGPSFKGKMMSVKSQHMQMLVNEFK